MNYKLDERYRPTAITDVVGNPDIVNDCSQMIDSKQIPHLLLCGVPGTGKTSLAYVIIYSLYGPNAKGRYIEINASDDSRIEVIRTRVKEFASHSNANADTEFRIILLEEADEIPKKSQAALRRMMEKYSGHCRFILTCNYRWQIIDPLQSRCTVFEFKQITPDQMIPRLQFICNTEHITADPEALTYIAQKSKGDMRTALNTYIERFRKSNKPITIKLLQHIQVDSNAILTVIKHALNKRLNPALQSYLLLAQKGIQIREFINQICNVCMEQSYPDLMKADIMVLGLEAEQALLNGSQDDRVVAFLLGRLCQIGNSYRKQ